MKNLLLVAFCLMNVSIYSSDLLNIRGINSNQPVKSGLFNVQWSISSLEELGEVLIEVKRTCSSSIQNSSFKINLNQQKVSQGSYLVSLCDGNFIENTIKFTAKTQNGLIIQSDSLTIYSDTVAPKNPFVEKSGLSLSNEFLLFSGSVENETGGHVEFFYLTENNKKIILGGASILSDSSFNAVTFINNFPDHQVNLMSVAYDHAGNESRTVFVDVMSKENFNKSSLFKELYN
ncbi:hypothetical protein MJH12_13130 [bacterium]|nr:hypothetical protein [bacterium]